MAPRRHTQIGRERYSELVQISYRLIAERGFEGLRTRLVAEEAGVNIATLHYHFPTKEDLIQAVVDYVVGELSSNQAPGPKDPTPLQELRQEFEDVELRMQTTPELFIVLAELSVRAWRDPALAEILKGVEQNWQRHLQSILDRGARDGTFRPDLSTADVALSIMAQLRGLCYTAKTDAATMHSLIAQLLAQTERWIVSG